MFSFFSLFRFHEYEKTERYWFRQKKNFSKTVFLHVLKVLEYVSVDFRGVIVKLYPVPCTLYAVSQICKHDNLSNS